MNKRILNFKDFVNESTKQYSAVKANEALGEILLNDILKSRRYLSESDKVIFLAHLSEASINENLLDTIKGAVDKLKQVGGDIKADVLNKIETVVQSAKDFSSYIADLFTNMFKKILDYFNKKTEAVVAKGVDAIKSGKLKVEKASFNQLKKEKNYLQEIITFLTIEFPKMVINNLKTVFSKKLIEESLNFKGDDLFEDEHGDPKFGFMSQMANSLAKIPPFSLVSKIESIVAASTEKLLFYFSEFTKALGGPGPYEFVALSGIIGFIVGLEAEHKMKEWLLHNAMGLLTAEGLLKFIPFAKQFIMILGTVSLIVGTVHLIDHIIEIEGLDNHEEKPPVIAPVV